MKTGRLFVIQFVLALALLFFTACEEDEGACPDYDDYSDCLTDACSAEVNACMVNSDCLALMLCSADCGSDSCVESCISTYSGGQALAMNLVECGDASCSECP
ncbi:MAG: hypothetical protein JXX29_14295 [Deltaproteobacteria bacterium]|nr:hypothetical protein [Deltaproteobacteria bacterium]MBN2672849.1 hypothetical protein [Deltaproteobacteria bacterium]